MARYRSILGSGERLSDSLGMHRYRYYEGRLKAGVVCQSAPYPKRFYGHEIFARSNQDNSRSWFQYRSQRLSYQDLL